MNAIGTHILLELQDCNPQLLDDLEFVHRALEEAALAVGATIVGQSFHKFEPQGVTGILAIAESHISIHTWPEYGYAAVDVFTCGRSFSPRRAAELLVGRFGAGRHLLREFQRGPLTALAPVATS